MANSGRSDFDQLFRSRSIPEDEPYFVLRGQDLLGPPTVRAYVQLGQSAGADPAFLEMAAKQADAMKNWPKKKLPDVDLTDAERKQLAYAWSRRTWALGNYTAEAIAEERGRVLGLQQLFRPMSDAPIDGSGFLAYGIHDRDAPEGASRQVKAGDHWWSILLWDKWREPNQFVFSKDGAAPWSTPLAYLPLVVPQLAEVA